MHKIFLEIVFFLPFMKSINKFLSPFLEVKLLYGPVCPSVGRSVGRLVYWLVCHNFKFHFPCFYRNTCLSIHASGRSASVSLRIQSAN